MPEIYDEGKAKIDGFEIPVQCIVMHAGKGKEFRLKHYHEYVELLYGLSECDIKIWAEGKVYEVKTGDLCVINSGTAHAVISDIPEPEETILIGSYEGSEVFRSGVTYKRGNGKIFYFQPGHESFPTFYNESVQKIIKNAVYWVKSDYRKAIPCPQIKKIEK